MIPLGVLGSAQVAQGTLTDLILADSPVSFWPLDGNFTDVVSGVPMEHIQPGVQWEADPDYGAVLNSTNGAASRRADPRLSQSAYSYEYLAKMNLVGDKVEAVPFATWGGLASGSMILFRVQGMTPLARTYHGREFVESSRSRTLLSQWSHYAVTWDGSTQLTYINGTVVTTRSISAVPGNGASLAIGSYAASNSEFMNNGGRWPGLISRIAMYDRALPQAAVIAHAQAAGVA